MRTSNFDYKLPLGLIADRPIQRRGESRLLKISPNSGLMEDLSFNDFPRMLQPQDAIIVNDSKVIPARLYLHKESGGKVELLLERILDDGTALMQLHANRRPKKGARLILDRQSLEIIEYQGEFARIGAIDQDLRALLHKYGQVPLPPYIHRKPDQSDRERYQTVYAKHEGSVAAPTAGLHFSEQLIEQCKNAGAQIIPITLHIGAATFQPVRSEHIEQHNMHREYFHITKEARQRMLEAKQGGGRIIAVGTSVVRALETGGDYTEGHSPTTLFIRPGYKFKVVDAILTNFHLPKSSLIMLVSAFAGVQQTMQAYQHAIKQEYRFYSYGDAMFIQQCFNS
ncbi:MAG: tRNA preQ1(34) S-adenosylmethionine ribosyltransferase-isomerase QueA [Candidatus Porifericomitaceae bacterium WSBS_2022_MAG_OTU9]